MDSLALHDVDYVVSLAHLVTATIHRAKKHPGRCIKLSLKDGSVLSRTLHSDFCSELEWRGRCIDMSKAYKQVPVSRSSRPFAVLMVHHYETGRPVYFLSNSLPFGASASVSGFNWISRTLWFLTSHCCNMMGGVLYDHFPFVEPAKLCILASQSFEGLLRALGWRFSDDPKESHPFATEFDVMGVRLNVAALNGGAPLSQETNRPGLRRSKRFLKRLQRFPSWTKGRLRSYMATSALPWGFCLGKSLMVAARALPC